MHSQDDHGLPRRMHAEIPLWALCSDPKDQEFLEIFMHRRRNKDVWLRAGNEDDLPKDDHIISVGVFLDMFRRDTPGALKDQGFGIALEKYNKDKEKRERRNR